MILTVFNKLIRKKFNYPKIEFTNCLVDFTPCLIITFTDIFNIYIHCNKILRCPENSCIVYCNSNWSLRTNNCFCINILSISTDFFIIFSRINRFFIFAIDLIWLFCTVFKITNCFPILLIRICKIFYLVIQCYMICRSLFRYLLLDRGLLYFVLLWYNRFLYIVIIIICRSYFFFIQPLRIFRSFFWYFFWDN